jgi:hypothetical protein
MRIDRFKQPLRKLRKFGLELHLHTCGKVRESFEQPFNKGIGANLFRLAVERKSAGNLGEFASELSRRFA